jgi:16S rRNA G966 N2-methylase RsmD
LTAIELFCGAGGLALGLSNAGIQAKLLVDFDKHAIETLKVNRPKWNSLCASVADIDLIDFKDQIDQTNKTGGYSKLVQNLSIDNSKKTYISNLSQESMNSVMNQLENVNKMAQKLYQDILLLKSQGINKNGVYPSSKYR